MEQLEQVIRVNEGEESPSSTPSTPVSASNKKRLPSAESVSFPFCPHLILSPNWIEIKFDFLSFDLKSKLFISVEWSSFRFHVPLVFVIPYNSSPVNYIPFSIHRDGTPNTFLSTQDKSQKKVKENETNAEADEDEELVPDIDTDDFIACLLLCAVLDPTSPKIRRRREFWRQNRPANSIKLDSKYLSIGVNPTLSQASNSLVSNALAVNAFSTGSLASTAALKKSLERISENVSMSMTNRNALSLPQSFRNAASSKGCKNYSQGNLR